MLGHVNILICPWNIEATGCKTLLGNIVNSDTLYSMQDYNEDGKLSFSEFSDLINAFGNQIAADKVWTWLFIFGFQSFAFVFLIFFVTKYLLDILY